jgi:phage terminase large subunit GpA-like protein
MASVDTELKFASPAALLYESVEALKPPPPLTVSQWADKNRVLSPESSAEPGPWRTDRVPYTRDIMDAFSDPRIEEITFMASAQVAKTEVNNNAIGYFIDQDPGPMMFVLPTIELGESWSKDRLDPMCRDTPCLAGKLKETREAGMKRQQQRKSKSFPGGQLTIAGANSPASLSSRPVRFSLQDEVDRYPPSAGAEGDPSTLAAKRTTTFWNRKVARSSTPTLEDLSRIDAAYKASDQRKYFVPCPECKHLQTIEFENLIWDDMELYDLEGKKRVEAPREVETARAQSVQLACEGCGVLIPERQKAWMLANGKWIAQRPGGRHAGFFIWEGYSPWVRWHEIIANFIEARKHPDTLKVFFNTSLGRTWKEAREAVPWQVLHSRSEEYAAEAPAGVCVITAGADIQGDRIECEVVGWGKMEESWSLDYVVFEGDTSRRKVWDEFDKFLRGTTYAHEWGFDLPIVSCYVDSGHRAKETYDFVRGKGGPPRRVYATKGYAGMWRPPVTKPAKANDQGIRLFITGVDTIKFKVYSSLRVATEGPGFCHFPKTHQENYFHQLTAEEIKKKYVSGQPVLYFDLPKNKRNEALDCRVNAYAALAGLATRTFKMLDHEYKRLFAESEEFRKENGLTGGEVQTVVEKLVEALMPAAAVEPIKKRPKLKVTNTWN